MKRIFITGTGGFIGKNLTRYLSSKYQLLTPSSRELDLLNTEKVRQFLKVNRPDYIIHAAAVGGSRDTKDLKDIVSKNLRMFFNLVQNENLTKKIIYFGSGAEYDKSRPLKKVKEEDFGKRIPSDDYGFSKYICAKYTLVNQKHNIICLRLFGIYGPYEKYLIRFVSNAIVKNLYCLPITINQNVYFDYLYVEDLMPIIDYFLNHNPHYNSYNISSGKKVDLLTIAKTINKISHFKSKIIIKHPGLNNEYSGSNRRLRKEIKSLRFTPLITGIQKLFRWYKTRLKTLDRQKICEDPYLQHCLVNKPCL